MVVEIAVSILVVSYVGISCIIKILVYGFREEDLLTKEKE